MHTEGTTGWADACGAVHGESAGLTNVWRVEEEEQQEGPAGVALIYQRTGGLGRRGTGVAAERWWWKRLRRFWALGQRQVESGIGLMWAGQAHVRPALVQRGWMGGATPRDVEGKWHGASLSDLRQRHSTTPPCRPT